MSDQIEKIKRLREKTGAGVIDAKTALDEAQGSEKKATAILKSKGAEIAAKKSARATSQGLIDGYIHLGKIGVLVEVSCETDFVARNKEFKKFVHKITLQAACSKAKSVSELSKELYFKDESKTISDLLKEMIAKTGENIKIKRFARYVLRE